jgi:Arc/MetJ-type ribon-helix-helix transcriptional regulator
MGKTVTVVVNQQQTQMLDGLVAQGLGRTHAEVILAGFRRFCEEHPELVRPRATRREDAS